MIAYPKDWNKDYAQYINCKTSNDITEQRFIDILNKTIRENNVHNLAYSGGIDSTIILCLMSKIFKHVNTYTMTSRINHPDILFANIGSEKYKSNHTNIIIKADKTKGVYEQFFENINIDKIICGDGIDEFMCGYYKHQNDSKEMYKCCLSELVIEHLIPLNKNSQSIKVYLPYLGENLINIMVQIPLKEKVDKKYRKKFITKVAKHLNIPDKFITRCKYAFSEAFKMEDKHGKRNE